MKFLGIYPPDIQWKNEPRRGGTPLGLLSILGNLRSSGHEIAFLDAKIEGYDTFQPFDANPNVFVYGLTTEQIKERVAEINPDVVGVSLIHATTWHTTKSVIQAVKEVNPNIVTVLGGHQATGAAKYILESCSGLDFIVLAEGEETTNELLQALETKKDGSQVGGLAYRKNDKILFAEPRGIISDLDALADPAFDLMKRPFYEREELAHYGRPRKDSFLDVMISRGCPRACDFCTSTTFMGSKIRALSPERVVSLVEGMNQLGYGEFIMEDDEVLMLRQTHPKSFEAYLSALKSTEKLWMIDAGLYYPRITEDFVEELADAGCYRAFLPVENPSMEIMHSQRKYRELQTEKDAKRRIKEVSEMFRRNGIKYYNFIMTGFPQQTREMIQTDIDFGKFLREECGSQFVGFFFTHPYVGAKLYEMTSQLVDDNRRWETHPEYGFLVKPVYPGQNYSVEELESMCKRGHEIVNGDVQLTVGYQWDRR